MLNFYHVLYQACLAFIVLFIISKLLGKKQVAQLEFIDYVVAFLKTSGDFSILPKSDNTPVNRKDLKIQSPDEKLINILVYNSKISYKELDKINKNEDWLFKKLKIKNKKELKNIILASYDSTNDTMSINYRFPNNNK